MGSSAPAAAETAGGRPPARRRRRWWSRLLRGVGWLALAVVLVGGLAVWLLLREVESEAGKARIRALLRDRVGLEVDYRDLRISLGSGLRLRGARLFAARDVGDPMVAVEELAVSWVPRELVGSETRVREVLVRGVSLHLEQDGDGKWSLDKWLARLPRSERPPGPASPLSRLAEALSLSHALSLGKLTVEGVSLQLRRHLGPQVEEVVDLDGLRLSGEGGIGPGGPRLRARIDGPLRVDRRRTEAGKAAGAGRLRAPLTVEAGLEPSGGRAAVDLRFDENTLIEGLPAIAEVAHVDARLGLEPQAARSRLAVDLRLADAALAGQLGADLEEPEPGRLRAAITRIDLRAAVEGLARFVPAGAGALEGKGTLRVAGGGVAVGASEGPGVSGFLAAQGVPLTVRPGGSLSVAVEGDGLGWRGKQEYRTTRLAASVKLDERAATVKLDAPAVRVASRGVTVGADRLSVDLAARPEADGRIRLQGEIPVGGVRLALGPGGSSSVEGLRLGVDVAVQDRRIAGEVHVDLARGGWSSAGGRTAATARQSLIAVRMAGLALEPRRLFSAHGKLEVKGSVASTSLRRPQGLLQGDGVGLAASLVLSGRQPSELLVDMPMAHVQARRPDGKVLLAPTPGRVRFEGTGLRLEGRRLARSVARTVTTIDLGPLQAKVEAEKLPDDVTFKAHVVARDLAPLPLLLPERARDLEVPWDRVGLTLDSQGKLGIAPVLRIDHRTSLALDRPSLRSGGRALTARRVEIDLGSRGTLARHELDAQLRLVDVTLDGSRRDGTQRVGLKAELDLAAPRATLTIDGDGPAGPDGKLRVAVEYRRAAREVGYEVEGRLARLGLVPWLLPPAVRDKHRLAWDKLAVEASGSGRAGGLVREIKRDLVPVLEPQPIETLRGKQTLRLRLEGLAYEGESEREVKLPEVTLRLVVDAVDAAERRLEVEVEAPSATVATGGRRFEATRLHPRVTVAVHGSIVDGTADGTIDLGLGALKQDVLPLFPIGDLALSAKLRADSRGGVRLERLRLDNRRGGTTVEAQGGVELRPTTVLGTIVADRVPGRQSVSLSARVTQLVERLDGAPRELRGKGKVTLPLVVESGDLSVFHVATAAELDGVDLELPGKGLGVSGIHALVPIVQDLLLEPGRGVTMLGGVEVGPYSRLRFSDHQPFLSDRPFLRAEEVRLRSPDGRRAEPLRLGPVAGNLRVDRNLLALDQVEVVVPSGGTITGQCLVDLAGEDTRLLVRAAVTGLRPSDARDRLDASLALSLVPARLELEGGAEIVRISKRHMLDLLDLQDPHQADLGSNRVRLGLRAGFPKRVRLRFEQGFATLGIELGGLVGAIRIDEVRGIPIGPLLQRYLGPLLPSRSGVSEARR